MDKIKLLNDYKEQVEILSYRDKTNLDKIRRKGKMLITNLHGEDSAYMKDFEKISFYPSFAPSSESYQQERWIQGKNQITNLINTILEEQELFGTVTRASDQDNGIKDANKVFIVHGHDDEAKLSVARFVEKLGLKAIILHEQASKGKTIIEKFEDQALSSSFAIVLLTPDDIGYSKNKKDENNFRARQNVIFELGYFCGVLNRKNVSVLYKEGVEIPNDYLGVVYTQLDNSNGWQLSLAKEMKQSGMDVDMNKVFE
jgi:predicted nucleotide-binding protein